MKKRTKLIAVALSASLAIGTIGALAGCGEGGDSDTFTIWMGSSVNSEFYNNYGDNPVMQYLQKKFDIKLEFIQPIVGKEQDSFNNFIVAGEYPDMMDLSYYTDTLADLYDDGYGAALDLTGYIADYMPNYKKFLADNPELTRYEKVDGRYLSIRNFNPSVPNQWGGFMYRRDWIVKYDGNPDTPDADGKYKDGVKFPDGYLDEEGYDNPVTIADWEYMLNIFNAHKSETGMEYGITLPNIGYHETGELVGGFGGGGLWNLTEGATKGVYDTVQFGATSTNFRRYAERMNDWYKKGWLDPNFTSNSGQMFYALDGGNITSGKVGIWYGTLGHIGGLLATASSTVQPGLKGIDAWPARQPKETAESANPTVFYLDGQETARSWIVTKTAKNKNLEKFFTMLDWLCSEEGAIVKQYGLSKAQMEEYDIDTSVMTKRGLTDGAWSWCDAQGNAVTAGTEGALIKQDMKIISDSGDLKVAMCGDYFFGMGVSPSRVYEQAVSETQLAVQMRSHREWAAYTDYGNVRGSLKAQMTSEEGKTFNATQETIRTYLGQELPKLIKNGVTDSNWNSFLGGLRTRKCDKNTEVMQGVVDRVNGKK